MKKLVVLLAVFAVTGLAGATLLTNGSFNDPESGNVAPTGWSNWSWGSGWINRLNDSRGYDGSYFMEAGAMGWYSGGGGVYQTVTGITAGTEYTLTVDAAHPGWWKPKGWMALIWQDAAGAEISKNELNIINPTSYDIPIPWANYSLAAVAPAGATQVKVEFANYSGEGNVLFDNAVLVPEPVTLALLGLGGLFIRRRR